MVRGRTWVIVAIVCTVVAFVLFNASGRQDAAAQATLNPFWFMAGFSTSMWAWAFVIAALVACGVAWTKRPSAPGGRRRERMDVEAEMARIDDELARLKKP